jgi:hypothetical protein
MPVRKYYLQGVGKKKGTGLSFVCQLSTIKFKYQLVLVAGEYFCLLYGFLFTADTRRWKRTLHGRTLVGY